MLNSSARSLPMLADIRGTAFEYDKETGAVTISQTPKSELMAEAIRRGYRVVDNRIQISPVELAERISLYFSSRNSKSHSPEN